VTQNQKGEFEKHLEKLEKWLGESQAALDQSQTPADWFQQHAYPPDRDGWKRVHQHITDALEHIKAAQTEVMNELQHASASDASDGEE
jgi:rubrerythrin